MYQEEREELKVYLKTLSAFEITTKKRMFCEKLFLKKLTRILKKKDCIPFIIGKKQPYGVVIFEENSLRVISDFSKTSYKESLYTNVINPIDEWFEINGFDQILTENSEETEIEIKIRK